MATTEPWLLITDEQLAEGWMEYRTTAPIRGAQFIRHEFIVIERYSNGTVKVRNPALQFAEQAIDLRPRVGDVRYTCPVCQWTVTLTPQGDKEWTHDGAIEPRCRKDRFTLDRVVLAASDATHGT